MESAKSIFLSLLGLGMCVASLWQFYQAQLKRNGKTRFTKIPGDKRAQLATACLCALYILSIRIMTILVGLFALGQRLDLVSGMSLWGDLIMALAVAFVFDLLFLRKSDLAGARVDDKDK